jgi:putative transposase
LLAQVRVAQESGARIERIAECLNISEKTLKRWSVNPQKTDGRKHADKYVPHGLSDEEKENILKVVNSPQFRNLPPSKIVPLLADKGVYLASEATLYRLLKTEKQLAHREKSRPRKHKKPNALVAKAPNQVWSWDITYLKTQVRGSYFYLYMHIDIFSRKVVGWQVNEIESAELAADLFSELCKNERVIPHSLKLHSDNGAPMKGATMLATLQYLGVVPSFSRPSVSDDNPYSESLFKTMKYRPGYPENPFESIQAAQEWVADFVHWYNEEHLHSGINFVTPASRHNGEDEEILVKRKAVYEAAKAKNPGRWSGMTRAWKWESEVVLNSRKSDSVHQVSV